MSDITELFVSLLQEHGSVDIAEHVFKQSLNDDAVLKEEYSEWCHAVGSSEKRGFLDFCEDYIANQDSIYDSLSEYNDE